MKTFQPGCGLSLLAAVMLSSAAVPAYADARSDALQALPENVRALYTEAVDVAPAAFTDFKAPAKPWRWCHSESYMGNPWRVTFNDELARLVHRFPPSCCGNPPASCVERTELAVEIGERVIAHIGRKVGERTRRAREQRTGFADPERGDAGGGGARFPWDFTPLLIGLFTAAGGQWPPSP